MLARFFNGPDFVLFPRGRWRTEREKKLREKESKDIPKKKKKRNGEK